MKKIYRGFTLIELLVVIAILAVIVAMLLPSVKSAQFAAEKALDLTRHRGMGFAMRAYVAENYDTFPAAALNQDTNSPNFGQPLYDYGGWGWLMPPYLGYGPVEKSDFSTNYKKGNYPSMACPSREEGLYARGSYATVDFPHWMIALSYGLQTQPYTEHPTLDGVYVPNSSYGDTANNKYSLELSDIETPSDIMMFGDNGYYASIIHSKSMKDFGVEGHPVPDISSPNHDGRGNSMTFVDLSAKFVPTLAPFVFDPDAEWNQKSAWPKTSRGHAVAPVLLP